MGSHNARSRHISPRARATTRAICGIFVSAILILASPWISYAGVNQGGRFTSSSTAFDGVKALVQGVNFFPGSSNCLLYSILTSRDTQPTRHVEAGLVRCNGITIDGTCDDVRFVDYYNSNTYTCYPHGTFNTGSYYSIQISRKTATTSSFTAYLGGGEYETFPGFSTSDKLTFIAWGEQTGQYTSCDGWTGQGTFTDFSRLYIGDGWSYPQTTQVRTTCWTVGSMSSTGDFLVVE